MYGRSYFMFTCFDNSQYQSWKKNLKFEVMHRQHQSKGIANTLVKILS
jgi:hypothetical protein